MKNNKQIQRILKKSNVDAILVYADTFDCRFYKFLTGLDILTSGFVLIDSISIKLITFSYLVDDLKGKTDLEILSFEDDRTIQKDLEKILVSFKSVGIVGNCPMRFLSSKNKFLDITKEFEVLITNKSEKDIMGITASAKLLSRIMDMTRSAISKGMTNEKEIEKFIKKMINENSDKEAFPVSICTDELLLKSTIGTARNRNFKKYMCIDAGLIKNGYYSDITRMFFIEKDLVQKSYLKLKEISKRVSSKKNNFKSVTELKNAYAKELKIIGLPSSLNGEYIGHGVGYGLHEFPVFYQEESCDFKFKKGNVFTLEPEVLLENGVNIRIEDMYSIESKGGIIQLTY